MATSPTFKEAVHAVLRSRRWTPATDIEAVGGADGLRRMRELRADGYEIKSRIAPSGYSEYRMVSGPQTV
jgi:hypothetical protein